MPIHTSTIYVELSIPVEVSYEITNDGIGQWECHGRGFDKGTTTLDVLDITASSLTQINGDFYLKLDHFDMKEIKDALAKAEDDMADEIGREDGV